MIERSLLDMRTNNAGLTNSLAIPGLYWQRAARSHLFYTLETLEKFVCEFFCFPVAGGLRRARVPRSSNSVTFAPGSNKPHLEENHKRTFPSVSIPEAGRRDFEIPKKIASD
ncbi:MAG TPA: hypothetical protein DC047_13500 [Blastocatellia bacterium]|nr:hypothetical protein [Blastocatellia bacterium]